MKLAWLAVLFANAALAASPVDILGTWNLRYAGPPGTGFKTLGSIAFDLNVKGDEVTGTAHLSSWPGDAPIAGGKIDGEHITFTATGTRSSTTGIPTCQFDVTVHGNEMVVFMSVIRNSFMTDGARLEFRGTKTSK